MNILNKIISLIQGEDENQKHISGKTVWSFLAQIAAAALVFASNILLTRAMGATEYGIYTFAFSLALLFSGIATSGFVNILIRRTAGYIETKKYPLLKGILAWSLKHVLIISLLLSIAGCIFFWKTGLDNIAYRLPILLALGSVPLLSLIIYYQSVLNGGHFVIESQLPEKIIKPTFIILFILLLFTVYNKDSNSVILALVNISATLIALAYVFYSYKKNISPLINAQEKQSDIPEWKVNYRGLLLLGILSILNARLDIIMTGILALPKQVGIYNISCRISELISFSLFVINISLAPMISKLYSSEQTEALQRMVTKTARVTLLIAFPVLLVIIFAGPFILSLFGEEFKGGYHSLLILSAAQLVSVLAGSSGYLLTMTGNERSATTAMLLSIIINIILGILLIPPLGIEGAAYSTAISTIVWNICMAGLAKIKTGINPTFIGK